MVIVLNIHSVHSVGNKWWIDRFDIKFQIQFTFNEIDLVVMF